MILKGNVTISRATSNVENDYIRIVVRDEESGTQFVTVEVSLAEFAQAITGLGAVPCQLDVRGLHNVGKRREVKREVLPALVNAREADALARAEAAIAPLEVDGWRGEAGDYLLLSRRKQGDVTVVFTRFVDMETEEETNG